MANIPVTPRERARIVAALKTGQSFGATAREFGRGIATIVRIAKAEGIAGDRSATKNAGEARAADNASRRAALAAGLLDDVEWIRARFRARTVSVGDREVEVPDAPPDALRNLMVSLGIAVDKSLALERHDTDEHGLSAVDAWLKGMVGSAEQ